MTTRPRSVRRHLLLLATVTALVAVGCDKASPSTAPSTTAPAPVTTTTAAGPSTTAAATPTTAPTTASYDPYVGAAAGIKPTKRTTIGQIPTADGRTRTYRLHVPGSVSASKPTPLLVALHGGMGTSAQFEANSGFDDLAESNGFIVVYPDGIGSQPDGSGLQTWNGGYCCGPAAARKVDDVGFVRQLIVKLRAEHSIDPARIFAAGHSNGAIMAYRLACELSNQIVAIGLQAGSLGIDTCTPSQPVSVFHLHGTADTNHPIDGGKGDGVAGVDFHSALSAVQALATADGCPSKPTPATAASNRDLTISTWSPCKGGTAVRYVVVAGATHAWMGHPAASGAASSYVGVPYPDLDASRAIWSFLVAHPRA